MPANNYRHGKCRTRVYAVWCNMINRCGNPRAGSFKDYGAKGIRVCDDWLRFENFFRDMGEPPKGMTLDRIDNSLGYCSSNCRWATRAQQARNYSRNVMLTIRGTTACVMDWANASGEKPSKIYYRARKGWPALEAVFGRGAK